MPFRSAGDLLPSRTRILSPQETASYSKDMLRGLQAIAKRQRHFRLAELLDAAVGEAERLADSSPRKRQSGE
jgi:hypothetical protein